MFSHIKRLLAQMGPRRQSRPANAVGETHFPLTFPDDVADHVRECYARAEAVFEYGSGGSTRLAAEIGVPCLAVESDAAWAAALTRQLAAQFGQAPSARVVHVDIGQTKDWGYPVDASQWERFWQYPMRPWTATPGFEPDLVLIDGRMREACFAATLLHVSRETTILFDDYTDRPFYHAVADIVAPVRCVGRMAAFVVTPYMLKQDQFQQLIPWFFDLK